MLTHFENLSFTLPYDRASSRGWGRGGSRCFCTNNSLVSPMLWPAGAVASIKGNGFIGIWFQVTCEHCREVDGSTVSSVHGCSSQNSSQGSARTCENTSFPQKYIFLFLFSVRGQQSVCFTNVTHPTCNIVSSGTSCCRTVQDLQYVLEYFAVLFAKMSVLFVIFEVPPVLFSVLHCCMNTAFYILYFTQFFCESSFHSRSALHSVWLNLRVFCILLSGFIWF